ncbi:MAG: alpha/beta hydrolase [Polyangiaceae bacterium]|nr:alpha/beta hydrolase [Polyangiaceae bacterium]
MSAAAPIYSAPPASQSLLLLTAHEVESEDGTRVAYYTTRGPSPDAPVIVLANGLGGPRHAWKALIEYLGDRYRFVTWDYRGLYGSGRPPHDRPDAYSIERHVEDLRAILGDLGVANASLVGWSMGVQVCLETYRKAPELARNLVLLNGTFGRPIDTAVPGPLARRAVEPALLLAQRYASPVQRLMRAAAAQPEFVGWMKRFGMIGETLEESEFAEVVSMFRSLDVEVYVKNLRALGEHDASRILETIEAPVLVITGDRDRMTPYGLSQQMVRRLPRAEILVVRGGTHYTAVEFPELVGLRIERFFHDHGF